MIRLLYFLLCSTAILAAARAQDEAQWQLHPDLNVRALTEHVYLHESFMSLPPYGRFGSNGLVYCLDGACVVFDTPVNDTLSHLLLQWVADTLQAEVVGVVVTHFHDDCLGGLATFHAAGIPSYSYRLTRRLAAEEEVTVPERGIGRRKTLRLLDEPIHLYFPGGGHTRDNIVAYLPAERVLFGGCLVKSLGAGRGNLADADVPAWPASVQRVKDAFPAAATVVPGHGRVGDQALL
ncbi:MAG: subclass B1 metallo-beta-lactamase, partial [Lewinella sp.]|nr:subclass B1 metallo-beta-lactamase [Lewinella sp.]